MLQRRTALVKMQICVAHEDLSMTKPSVMILVEEVEVDGVHPARQFTTPEKLDRFVSRLRSAQQVAWPGHVPSYKDVDPTLDFSNKEGNN